jgi:glycosyltransferase involved in cell wall biosynthesis
MCAHESIFSVVMPAYNAEATIEQAIRSVVAQTYPGWELLIVDDASSDRSLELAQSLAATDSRIRVLSSPINTGVARARNIGLQAAIGRYIAFLDADDHWLPRKLELQMAEFTHGAKVVFGSYHRFTIHGACGTVWAKARVTSQDMLRHNFIGNLTAAYDRDALGLALQEPIPHEDYVMWYRLVALSGQAHGINEPLACYRVATASLSGNKLRAARWHWDILRRSFAVPLHVASYYFVLYVILSLGLRIGVAGRLQHKARRTDCTQCCGRSGRESAREGLKA